MLPLLIASLLGASAGTAQTPADPVAARYALCSKDLAGTASNGAMRLTSRAEDTICFGGAITPESMAALMQAVRAVPANRPLQLVLLSSGGHASAALEVAEELLRRDVTVVTGPICASACANYLFMAADRRVVGPKSILAFHGGRSASLIGQVEAALAAARAKKDGAATAQLTAALQRLQAERPREQALLRAAGVDVAFFDRFDRLTPCPGTRVRAFVFSPEALGRSGVKVSGWFGPKSEAQLQALLAPAGLSGTMCYRG